MITITNGMTPAVFVSALNSNFSKMPGCITLTTLSRYLDINSNYAIIRGICPMITLTDIAPGDSGQTLVSKLNSNFTIIENFAMNLEVTVDANTSITLPFINNVNVTYNCKVDFGDGSPLVVITAYNDADITHVYANAGVYDIKIYGKCGAFLIGPNTVSSSQPISGMQLLITKVNSWGNVGLYTFNFYECANLASIPTDTYGAFSLVTYMDSAFQLTDIEVIPTGLLNYATKVVSLANCFAGDDQDYYTSKVSVIPTGLIDNCAELTSTVNMFRCACIEVIPDGFFDNCVKLTHIGYTFKKCPITSIPVGLLDNLVNLVSVREFMLGTLVAQIPEHLFDNCTLLEDVAYLFSMLPITSIPADILKYNVNITTVYGLFWKTPGLLNIPSTLLSTLTKVTNVRIMAEGVTALQSIPLTLFSNCPLITTFERTFNGCINVDGNAPTIWTTYPDANIDSAFGGCVNLDNYDEIPSEAKVFIPVYI